MDLIAKNSGGYQVVGRPQARSAWQPPDQVRPARVEVWWRYAGEVAAAARLIGLFAPGQVVQVPLNPGSDRDLIFSTISRSSDGVRSARELAEAHEQTISFARPATPAGGDLTGFYPDPTIKADAVTYAKMQNIAAGSRLLGRGATGPGDPEEIALGSGLSMSASILSAALGGPAGGDLTGTYPDPTIKADAVTYAKLQNVSAAARLLGRGSAAGTGDAEEITLGAGLSMAGTVLSPAAVKWARAFHSITQTLTTSVAASIELNSERADTDSIHDTVTNNSRLTCKTAGLYLLTACLGYAANASGVRSTLIRFNGTNMIASTQTAASAGGQITRHTVTAIYPLAVNDYVELIGYQDSGGNLNTEATAMISPEFMIARLGP